MPNQKKCQISKLESALKTAIQVGEPDGRSQKKMIAELMPLIAELKKEYFSWTQITKFLTDAGMNLKPKTVKNYYHSIHPKSATPKSQP